MKLVSMRQSEKPQVFVDTNILKCAARTKRVRLAHRQRVEWGEIVEHFDVYRPYIHRSIHRMRNTAQRRDAFFISLIAYLGIKGHAVFWTHHEVLIETLNLPGMANIYGLFYGCPLEKISNPEGKRERIIAGGGKTFDEHTLDYLSEIKCTRFREICKYTGAFQGKNRPMNVNQALDAYHIWCADTFGMDYFLTIDYKLIRHVRNNKNAKFCFDFINPKDMYEKILKNIGFPISWVLAAGSLIFAMRRVLGKEYVEIDDL